MSPGRLPKNGTRGKYWIRSPATINNNPVKIRNLPIAKSIQLMTNKGKLFLIPNVIAENTQDKVIPLHVIESIGKIQHFLVEDVRTARRFLSSLKLFPSIENLKFSVLNKDTDVNAMAGLFEPVFAGFDIGVISEAGCPGVADPGALAVDFAHRNSVAVIPLVGPSSILLALMASGLNGQRFAFHGYLPIETREAVKTIKDFESESKAKNQTQIFIETPYRNNQLLDKLLNTLLPGTMLTVALDLTGENEKVNTKTVKQWRAQTLEMPKMPAIFLFLA
jgi:16S rRNA (cytidine1402-2'-O)-methyltransferase